MPTRIRAEVWRNRPGEWAIQLNTWMHPGVPTYDDWPSAMAAANTAVRTARKQRWEF